MNNLRHLRYFFYLSFLGLFFIACKDSAQPQAVEQLEIERDSLAQQLEVTRKTLDSLEQNPVLEEQETNYPIYFGSEFENIEDPEAFIINSLREQTDLIPLDAVLGGTMAFRSIVVLNEKWVMALYDDGHIQGQAIYEYNLQPDGSLEFEVRLFDHP